MINILTCSRNAIVTTGAGTQHLGVIHGDCWLPNTGRVAIFASVGAVYVLQTLAGGGNAIMATGTRTQYL